MQIRFLALRASLIGVLTFGVVPAYAAIGGQPDATDVKTIDACLADAAKDKADPGACIGRVMSGCLEKAASTAAMEECTDREFAVWDAALNRDYMELTMLVTDNNVKQALRDTERDFYVSQLKRCTFERLLHKDSSDALVSAARCKVRSTARQAIWLNEQIKSLQSH